MCRPNSKQVAGRVWNEWVDQHQKQAVHFVGKPLMLSTAESSSLAVHVSEDVLPQLGPGGQPDTAWLRG
jgi:hypothetical protein